MIQWLSDQHCRQFKYDFDGSGWISDLSGLAAAEED
jgi:hypothetical protein